MMQIVIIAVIWILLIFQIYFQDAILGVIDSFTNPSSNLSITVDLASRLFLYLIIVNSLFLK